MKILLSLMILAFLSGASFATENSGDDNPTGKDCSGKINDQATEKQTPDASAGTEKPKQEAAISQ